MLVFQCGYFNAAPHAHDARKMQIFLPVGVAVYRIIDTLYNQPLPAPPPAPP
jgi:hypothetical protein